MEMEILYDSLLKLHKNNTITINPDLKHQLKSEFTKQLDFHSSKYRTKDIRLAAKQLKNHQDITVRKADKSNIFVNSFFICHQNVAVVLVANYPIPGGTLMGGHQSGAALCRRYVYSSGIGALSNLLSILGQQSYRDIILISSECT